jgi:hypothetical protein
MTTGHREPIIVVDLSEESLFARSPMACRGRFGETSIHRIAMLSDDAEISGWHLTVYVVLIAEAIVRSLAYR